MCESELESLGSTIGESARVQMEREVYLRAVARAFSCQRRFGNALTGVL